MLAIILSFILGGIVGGTVTIIIMACLKVGHTDDKYSEQENNNKNKN